MGVWTLSEISDTLIWNRNKLCRAVFKKEKKCRVHVKHNTSSPFQKLEKFPFIFLQPAKLWYNKKKISNNRIKFLQYWRPWAKLLRWWVIKNYEALFCNTKLAPVLLGQFHLHLSFKQTKSRSSYSTSWNTRLDVGPFQPCCHFWHKDCQKRQG